MNKSKIAFGLLLSLSIISPSCDSKPKPGPAQPVPTEQTPAEPAPAAQTPAAQEQVEQAPVEPAPAEQSASAEAPSGQPPSEEASSEVGQTEPAPTEEASAEEESPEDILLKAKFDYLKLLYKSMGNALEQKKLGKVSGFAKEIHKVAAEANAEQEAGDSDPSELTGEQPSEYTADHDAKDSEDAGRSSETVDNQEENKTEEQAAEGESDSAETASAEKEDEKSQPSKYQIRIDVVPRNSSKKDGYFMNEEVSLKIKVANLSLKEETGPIVLEYFILGKGVKNNDEFVLLDSGGESFELGKTLTDRSFEYTPSPLTNKYGTSSGSGNFKYEAWFVAVLDDEGNVIQIKSNKQTLKDYNLIKDMDKNYRYDKSFNKLNKE